MYLFQSQGHMFFQNIGFRRPDIESKKRSVKVLGKMASQSPTDLILPQWKKGGKQTKDPAKPEDEKKPASVKISESTKPILEEQALLQVKLKNKPAWRKDRESHPRKKTQPVVARPPSPGSSSFRAPSAPPSSPSVPSRPPSPPSRRRSPSPISSVTRSSSPQLDVSQDFSRKVEKASKARLYLLQQTGPNSFLIRGDSPDHKFRVMIGNQSCSCGRPFCLHLLFVMLRVFKVKENDPILWSQNLKNFEVESLFSKYHDRFNSRISKNQKGSRPRSSRLTPPASPSTVSSPSSSSSNSSKEEEEMCPICLLEMAEGESLTACKGGCNNRLHQHCMEVWAGECKRQKEPIICPLCRKVWVSDKSPTRSARTVSPNVPTPLEQGEITLPHSDPIPHERVELARPWVEAFGDDLVSCIFSREWIIRETALRRLSKDIVTKLNATADVSECRRAVEACCSLLEMMCGDRVYNVYVAALRTLRVMLAYTSCSTREERIWLQKTLFPVIEAILAKCADSNRRISALAIKVLLEMCKDQSGEMAIGKMRNNPQRHSIGGLNFMLSNILVAPPEYSAFPWWLGRLYFLKKILDDYYSEFELTSDCPNRNMDTEGLLTHEGGAWGSFDLTEMYEDNLMRLMAVLRFSMLAANCSHSKVTKIAVTILICCTGLSAKSPSAFIHVKKMVGTLKPTQRGILQRQLTSMANRNEETDSDEHLPQEQYDSTSMGSAYSALLQHNITNQSVSGTYVGDETDNFADTELQNLQEIVESFAQPRHLALPVTPPSSPTRDLHLELEWSKYEPDTSHDSPRLPPIKMPIGKKCIDVIEQEEAEALAKALELSSLLTSPQRIPSLTPTPDEDEMVIVFTQPESLEKAINDKHLYLEDVHWKKGELLGTGAFSSCYAARDVQSGTLMAVKQMSFCRNSLEEQEKVTQTILEEIDLMARIQHRHLIKCLGATRHRAHFNIFLEWMPGGAIANLISKYGPFEESVLVRYSMQMLQGVDFLHENGVIHRDIKGANILVDSTGQNIRIADFGAAARLASQITGAGEFQGQLLGTIAFMAPEVLRGESYGRSCDIWSVGCVIVEMATGKPPWNAHEHSNHLALIFKIACATSPPDIPQHLNPAIRDVIRRCFESKPDERPAASELLKHPLFRTTSSLPISTQTSRSCR